MLSRAALSPKTSALRLITGLYPQVLCKVGAASDVSKPNPGAVSEERDLVNFPRQIQPTYGGKVRMGFVPDEWFQFFYRKTGVTGPYIFYGGLITFLCSKEWFIMEHEYYTGCSLAIMAYVAIKKFGPATAEFLDKENEKMYGWLKTYQPNAIASLEEANKGEKEEQWRAASQKLIFDAKRENVALQLEAEYRKRMMHTYQEVKKRLDYQVQSLNVMRQVQHSHMARWVIDNVVRSITPQQEEDALKKCIADLKALSVAG